MSDLETRLRGLAGAESDPVAKTDVLRRVQRQRARLATGVGVGTFAIAAAVGAPVMMLLANNQTATTQSQIKSSAGATSEPNSAVKTLYPTPSPKPMPQGWVEKQGYFSQVVPADKPNTYVVDYCGDYPNGYLLRTVVDESQPDRVLVYYVEAGENTPDDQPVPAICRQERLEFSLSQPLGDRKLVSERKLKDGKKEIIAVSVANGGNPGPAPTAPSTSAPAPKPTAPEKSQAVLKCPAQRNTQVFQFPPTIAGVTTLEALPAKNIVGVTACVYEKRGDQLQLKNEKKIGDGLAALQRDASSFDGTRQNATPDDWGAVSLLLDYGQGQIIRFDVTSAGGRSYTDQGIAKDDRLVTKAREAAQTGRWPT